MRLNILTFAFGVCSCRCGRFAAWLPWTVIGGLPLVPRLRWKNVGGQVLAVLACLCLRFAWGAWRADLRLADDGQPRGRAGDIEVLGVVASLPQDFSHGTRFEFARKHVHRSSQNPRANYAFVVPVTALGRDQQRRKCFARRALAFDGAFGSGRTVMQTRRF